MDTSELGSTMKELAKMLEKEGVQIGYHEPVCITYLAEHKVCTGCSSELGCAKLIATTSLLVKSMVYIPKSFDEFLSMDKKIGEIQKKIIAAKTVDEVHSYL